MSSASITIRRKDRPGLTSFSIPVLVLWWLIPPLAFALAPLVILFCLLDGLDPVDFYVALWHVLRSLDGTEFEHEDSRRTFSIRIAAERVL